MCTSFLSLSCQLTSHHDDSVYNQLTITLDTHPTHTQTHTRTHTITHTQKVYICPVAILSVCGDDIILRLSNYHTHTHTYTHALNTHTLNTHTHNLTHAHTHIHTHTRVSSLPIYNTHTHSNTHAHTHTNTHTITHTHTHTHTHTQGYRLFLSTILIFLSFDLVLPYVYSMGWLRLVGSLKV